VLESCEMASLLAGSGMASVSLHQVLANDELLDL